MKFAEHLSCQTPLDSTHTKKIAYTIFKDCMIISMYQQNSQLTFTNSKLTVEQEAKYVQKTPERHQLTACSGQLTSLWCFFVNFGHIFHRFLVVLLLTLNR